MEKAAPAKATTRVKMHEIHVVVHFLRLVNLYISISS